MIEESLENTNVRAPFDGVVIKKRTEVGETVSPFGVAGQAAREGGAIATIADLHELEVQTEVAETSVGKLSRGLPADVKLQAYPDSPNFPDASAKSSPSADRAKAIVEVRVTILNPSADVKPELTASVTFQQPAAAQPAAPAVDANAPAAPTVVVSKRAVADRTGQKAVFVVTNGLAVMRAVVLGPDAVERLDQVEVKAGLVPGEVGDPVNVIQKRRIARRRSRVSGSWPPITFRAVSWCLALIGSTGRGPERARARRGGHRERAGGIDQARTVRVKIKGADNRAD